jgi:hypothetical protein
MNKRQKFDRAFEDCLAQVQNGDLTLEAALAAYPDFADELRPALTTALAVNTRSSGYDPRPGFLEGNRAYLLHQIQKDARPVRGGLSSSWLAQVMLVAIVVLGLLAGSTGMALASESALPGDGLFPVRMAVEGAQLAVTLSAARDAELRLQFAQNYLVACASLISAERYDEAQLALQNYDRHLVGANRAIQTLRSIDDFEAQALAEAFNRVLVQDAMILEVLMRAVE